MKKEYLVLLYCFIILPLNPSPIDKPNNIKPCSEKPIFISLGHRCIPALFLRQFKLRHAAYPFDWMLTESFEHFCSVLKNDFKDFISKETLIIDSERPFIVKDQKTGFGFSHDFPFILNDQKMHLIVPNFLDAYQIVKEKYDRRIKRFQEALASSKKIIFLRFEIENNAEHAIKIHELIHAKYPTLNFFCIELSFSALYKIPWNIPGIRNFHIDPQAYKDLNWNAPCWTTIIKGIEDITNCSLAELITAQQQD